MKKNSGFSLLEVIVAAALIGILGLGFTRLIQTSAIGRRSTESTEAVTQYEELIRGEVLPRVKAFVEHMALGGPSPGGCAVPFNFEANNSSESQFNDCLSFKLPAGLNFSLVGSGGEPPAFPVPAGSAPSDNPAYAKYLNCARKLSVRGAKSNYATTQNIFFCLAVTPNNASLVGYHDLTKMQPLFIEFNYFNFFATPTQNGATPGYLFPTGAGIPSPVPINPPHYATPSVMTVAELGRIYNAQTPPALAVPVPPIMNYLYYTFYWTGTGNSKPIYRRYNGFYALGNGNG